MVGTPDAPVYTKRKQDERLGLRVVDAVMPERPTGTQFWSIDVDEGWRTWILCTDMYEWAADELLARLRENNRRWPHAS